MVTLVLGSPLRARGFTLIELMIVMVVLAVVISLASPALSEMVRMQRIRSVAVDLYADVTLARSEAIKRGAQVFVVPRDSADWARGWDVATANPPTATTTLKSQDPFSGGVATPCTTGSCTVVTFGRAGRPTTTAVTRFQVSHSELASDKWRCVSVDLAGRPESKTGVCP
jgi:type IV fimbrial biogenesis protein FimT